MSRRNTLSEIVELEDRVRSAEEYYDACRTSAKAARENVDQAIMELRTYIHEMKTGQASLFELPTRQTEEEREAEEERSDTPGDTDAAR